MKEINNISEYQLDTSEIHEAMLEYLQREKKLHKAIVYFVENVKQLGFVNRVMVDTEKKGGVTAYIQVGKKDGAPIFINNGQPVGTEEHRRQAFGFKRKNFGFYKELVAFLATQKKAKKKQVTFDDAFAHLSKLYPHLNERYFMIYASDKRQQEKKKYTYDGSKRLFIL